GHAPAQFARPRKDWGCSRAKGVREQRCIARQVWSAASLPKTTVSCLVARRQLLTDHHPMPIRRSYDELPHAMRSVGWSLQYDGASADQLTVKCVGIIDIKVS